MQAKVVVERQKKIIAEFEHKASQQESERIEESKQEKRIPVPSPSNKKAFSTPLANRQPVIDEEMQATYSPMIPPQSKIIADIGTQT